MVLAGGISPRPKPVVVAGPVTAEPEFDDDEAVTGPLNPGDDTERVPTAKNIGESRSERTVAEAGPEPGAPEREREPEPGLPPPPVRPAPEVEDVEDLMFVDDDIDTDADGADR